jgi:predicted PurR-regulated permease PerM
LFTGLTSQFIPSVGTYIGIALPILVAVAHQPLDAVWVIVGATVYQQVENLFIGPRLGRATMNIHPAVALGSVFVGAALLGATGALISVPVAAAIISVAQAYAHRYDIIDGVEEASTTG